MQLRANGYDTKNAAHLIRLLRMGIEFMRDGRLYVQRADAAELLEIKRGEWSLAKVREVSEQAFVDFKAEDAKSSLPPEPNYEAVERWMVELLGNTLANPKGAK